MLSDRTRTIVLGVVTAVWAINFGAGLVIETYQPSEAINGIFMLVVGSVFALGRGKGNDNGDKKEDGG